MTKRIDSKSETKEMSGKKSTRKAATVTAISSAKKARSESVTELDPTEDSTSDERSGSPLPLSLKEKNVLEFLELYMLDKGVSPTYQEICAHFGFASFNSVQRYLKQLEVKGYIRLPWANQKRAITLLHPASAHQNAAPTQSLTRAIMPTESLSLPLLGRVAAGAPIEAVEHDEFIEVPSSLVRHADRTYALRVQGQSMIDDGILDGDVILVQRQSTAQNGEIVVAMVGEEATVKRFYAHRGAKNIPQAALDALFERLGSADAGEMSGGEDSAEDRSIK